jgi:S-DNA-T family DNA segregation ATPase FtsK/SpoIIIE
VCSSDLGAYLSEYEAEKVAEKAKEYSEPDYIDDEIFIDDEDDEDGNYDNSYGDDPLMDKAIEVVASAGKASASYLQRRLKIGYNRAARLVEEMERRGIVGPQNGSKPRDILNIQGKGFDNNYK